MPSRAKRPCAHPGCPELVDKGYCEKHQKARLRDDRAYDKQRGSAASRGYNYRWQKYRKWFFMQPENVLCVKCLEEGFYELATEIDHIVPVTGPNDPGFYEPTNHQPLCHSCHSRKTAGEDGGFKGRIDFYPKDLKPSAIPLTIIYGPPAAGKSTYVKDHEAPGDIVIDLGAIRAGLAFTVEYDAPTKYLRPAVEKRNELLRSLATERRPVKAWFIVGAPTQRERDYWNKALKPLETVMLDTPEDECIARIMKDPLRKSRLIPEEQQIQAIKRWWKLYDYI